MSSDIVVFKFERAIEKALQQFEQRLKQQQLFQIQNDLLKEMQKEVAMLGFCDSESVRDLSEQYQAFYIQLKESGRSYENIVAEKNLVDTYSAFEKFLSDCRIAVYLSFPKFLGSEVTVNTLELFINSNIAICKDTVVGTKVKDFIQGKNIMDILKGFNQEPFYIKTENLKFSQEELELFYEIGLIRNLITHNNGIVNRTYKESVKKLQNREKYPFNEGETVLIKLEDIFQDIKQLSEVLSNRIAEAIINHSSFLYHYHENPSTKKTL